MSKKQFGINLTVEVGQWALGAATRYGFANRSALIDGLLMALQAGQISVAPQPNAFPAKSFPPLGSSPTNPLPYARGPS